MPHQFGCSTSGLHLGFPQLFLLLAFHLRGSEWYGYHFPELVKIVADNSTYCRVAKLIGNRKELSEENLEALEEIVMDSAKAQAILDASRSSMGKGTHGISQQSLFLSLAWKS